MKTQKILVIGGNGKTGRRVAQRLQTLNHVDVRLASRSTGPSFDWENPATWEAALTGADTIYITYQPDLAVPSAVPTMQQFTRLATQLGVQKMVLLSGRGEKEAQVCEEIVKNTARQWCIVQASWFHQNFSESFFLEPVQAGYVALPRAEALEPFTDADDIADVVVEALLDNRHNQQTYELTGPELLTFAQAVAIIASATNRRIAFQPLTLEEYTHMLRSYQVPEDFIWLANYLFSEVLDGRNASTTHDIEKVLGRKPKSFATYAQETVSSGVWNALTPSEL
jgi:uncharacterized protein YbjT (DUF2867 family)